MSKRTGGDIAALRREQIVNAAVTVISGQGIQHLSLSEIEKHAGLCRGQLTYYFPTKEAILLAVFERLVQMMRRRANGEGDWPAVPAAAGWERIRFFLSMLVVRPGSPEFKSLQYTFLSQIGHRPDYRQRLADLYEEWRQAIARDVEAELLRCRAPKRASARTVASLIQAILHGLAVQGDADPAGFDRHEMLALCLDLIGGYLEREPPARSDSGPDEPPALTARPAIDPTSAEPSPAETTADRPPPAGRRRPGRVIPEPHG